MYANPRSQPWALLTVHTQSKAGDVKLCTSATLDSLHDADMVGKMKEPADRFRNRAKRSARLIAQGMCWSHRCVAGSPFGQLVGCASDRSKAQWHSMHATPNSLAAYYPLRNMILIRQMFCFMSSAPAQYRLWPPLWPTAAAFALPCSRVKCRLCRSASKPPPTNVHQAYL